LNGKEILIVKSEPKIIVITGAESTGKSTLASALSSHLSAPVIPEFARCYIENLDRKYNFEDVEFIAKKQVEELNKLQASKQPIIILDTWLLITKIWFDVVFNKVPNWLDAKIRSTNINLVLVCDIDLPWVADKVRENGGINRSILQNKYLKEIEEYDFDHRIVSGKGEERINNAIKYVTKQR